MAAVEQRPAPQDDALGYAPAPPRGRKWVRRVLLWGVLPLGAVALLLWGFVPARNKFTFLHHQSKCMAFAAPPGTIAYTEDPATVARLTGGAASGPGWATLSHNAKVIAYYLMPASLRYLETRPDVDIPQGSGPVFLHGRAVPGGGARLVVAKVDPMRSYRAVPGGPSVGDHALDVSVMTPAGLRAGPNVTRTLWRPDGAAVSFGELTFFVGQPDANDESHFTIDYQTPAGRGTIDGWLRADDSVNLVVRDGPLSDGDR